MFILSFKRGILSINEGGWGLNFVLRWKKGYGSRFVYISFWTARTPNLRWFKTW
jgi:hypothetical protein